MKFTKLDVDILTTISKRVKDLFLFKQGTFQTYLDEDKIEKDNICDGIEFTLSEPFPQDTIVNLPRLIKFIKHCSYNDIIFDGDSVKFIFDDGGTSYTTTQDIRLCVDPTHYISDEYMNMYHLLKKEGFEERKRIIPKFSFNLDHVKERLLKEYLPLFDNMGVKPYLQVQDQKLYLVSKSASFKFNAVIDNIIDVDEDLVSAGCFDKEAFKEAINNEIKSCDVYYTDYEIFFLDVKTLNNINYYLSIIEDNI